MYTIARLRFWRVEEPPSDAGTDPVVCTTELALVVPEALLDAEDDEELKVVEVEELKLNELELVEDGEGVGLGLGVVEGGGGGVQVVDGDGGCQVVVGAGGGCQVDVGDGAGAGELPKDHEP
jgi:hypothetical protein